MTPQPRLALAWLIIQLAYGIAEVATKLLHPDCPRRTYVQGRIEQARERVKIALKP